MALSCRFIRALYPDGAGASKAPSSGDQSLAPGQLRGFLRSHLGAANPQVGARMEHILAVGKHIETRPCDTPGNLTFLMGFGVKVVEFNRNSAKFL